MNNFPSKIPTIVLDHEIKDGQLFVKKYFKYIDENRKEIGYVDAVFDLKNLPDGGLDSIAFLINTGSEVLRRTELTPEDIKQQSKLKRILLFIKSLFF